MRLESDIRSEIRPVRRLALERGKAAGTGPEAEQGGHFLEPRRFSEREKSAALRKLKAQGIGDEEGRRLFVGAVGYELANHKVVRAEPPAPEPAPARPDAQSETLLQLLAQAAQEFGNLLEKIPGSLRAELLASLEENDRLHRGYDERYLDQLQCETARLVSACAMGLIAPEEETPPPPDDSFSRGLVRALAHVYEECFEETPTARADGPFATALAVVAESAELPLCCDPGFLAGVLADGGK